MGLLFTLLFLSPLFLLSQASSAELNTTRCALAGATNCNIFRSKLVYDASYPFYDFSSCPFIDDQFNCLKYRCPDRNYLKYQWQPFSCNLARCGPTAKRNYHLYGDIVSFDTTYSTNSSESLQSGLVALVQLYNSFEEFSRNKSSGVDGADQKSMEESLS
ncbi:hypothetical protein SASPL_107661 [Salvia splendens]|uniref:Trichome birefringence-like N-terminal domain-containing protein n=1 Tax=Salvia splendens TaxID=180675 RepID=A0A8X8YDU5_SALSN|nr:protein trichome birefringence-like 38 [Salvia splendens]KAG6429609.1 hypothetical protein SASPL_107661 [Salvia splendens]